jgi:hypothetical protein
MILRMILLSFCPTGSTAVRKVTVFVSDFGRKCMDIEAEYGPRGIWASKSSSLLTEGVDAQEDNDDLYDNIVADNDDDQDDNDDDYDDQDDEGSKNGIHKTALDGDFQRKNGVVGLVLHDDLQRLGKVSAADSQAKGSNCRASGMKGFDDVALRKYELSKLR